METVIILRWGLLMGCGVMTILGLTFLFQRECSTLGKILWAALAIALPVLGPFLVIVCRPGSFTTRLIKYRAARGWQTLSDNGEEQN